MYLQTPRWKIRFKPSRTQFSIGVEVDDGMLYVFGNGWGRRQRVAMPVRTRFFHKDQTVFNFAK